MKRRVLICSSDSGSGSSVAVLIHCRIPHLTTNLAVGFPRNVSDLDSMALMLLAFRL